MPKRYNVSSGTPWEAAVGYSRAVRVGNLIWISGTTATDESGNVTGLGDAYAQTIRSLENIENALRLAGAGLNDVVRTRIYTIDIAAHRADIGRAHRELFKNIRPAATMVEVKALIDPSMLVEIEADAVAAGPERTTDTAA